MPPFAKGKSGNPAGMPATPRSYRNWIPDEERVRQARISFYKLCKIRDGLVVERKVKKKKGRKVFIEVVPSVEEFVRVNQKIIDRSIGLPMQEVRINTDDGQPLEWNIHLNVTHQVQAPTSELPIESDAKLLLEGRKDFEFETEETEEAEVLENGDA